MNSSQQARSSFQPIESLARLGGKSFKRASGTSRRVRTSEGAQDMSKPAVLSLCIPGSKNMSLGCADFFIVLTSLTTYTVFIDCSRRHQPVDDLVLSRIQKVRTKLSGTPATLHRSARLRKCSCSRNDL